MKKIIIKASTIHKIRCKIIAEYVIVVFMICVNFEGFTQKMNSVGTYTNESINNNVFLETNKFDCSDNNGIAITTTGSVVSPYMTPTSFTGCLPNAAFAGNGWWTGGITSGVGGFVTYTFSQPITSARVTYSAVNGPNGSGTDVGRININGGGILTLTNPCGVTVTGDVLTASLGGPTTNNYGDVSITVNSTCPFTTIRLLNIGRQTGWVQGNPCNFILTPYSCNDPAPLLSNNSLNNVCPLTRVSLFNITASNLPQCNSVLTWHTGTPATFANTVTNSSSVGAGTYYASFFNSVSNCYSPTSPLVVTISSCCLPTLDITAPVNNNAATIISWREASDWIRASNRILIGNQTLGDGVVYHAGNYVELIPGFETFVNATFTQSSQFSAYIQNCSGIFLYKNEADEKEEIVFEADSNDLIKNNVSVYPNPTSGLLNVSLLKNKIKKVLLTSIEGKVYVFEQFDNSENVVLDLSNYSSGIYLINIETDQGEIINSKVIKK